MRLEKGRGFRAKRSVFFQIVAQLIDIIRNSFHLHFPIFGINAITEVSALSRCYLLNNGLSYSNKT